jgi:iron transport multicopper oxidase
MWHFLVTLGVLTLATPVLAGVQEIWYNISYVQGVNPDGLAERRAIGINGTWPYVYFLYFSFLSRSVITAGVIDTHILSTNQLNFGMFSPHFFLTAPLFRPPLIEVNTTDNLVVHATNGLSEPTTIHHHGMFFNSTSWYDGALDFTQWYTTIYFDVLYILMLWL